MGLTRITVYGEWLYYVRKSVVPVIARKPQEQLEQRPITYNGMTNTPNDKSFEL